MTRLAVVDNDKLKKLDKKLHISLFIWRVGNTSNISKNAGEKALYQSRSGSI